MLILVQVTFENSVRRGWLHGGARKVKKEALERLNSSGWDDLRPALRMTIRYAIIWVMAPAVNLSGLVGGL
jgi:hypothetical protein